MTASSNAARRLRSSTAANPIAHKAKAGAAKAPGKTPRPRLSRTPLHACPGRDELALKLLPLVRRVAFEMRERLPQHVGVDDLAGAGVIGLLDAVRKYDPRKHVKIETYARYRIRGAILDSLRDLDTASRDMRRKCKAAEKICHQLQMRLGRAVTDEEMAAAMGMCMKDWHHMMREISSAGMDWMRPGQIPEPSATDEASIPDDARDNAFDLCYRQEQKDLICRASSQLPDRERQVIALYYGQDMTMNEIGAVLRIDESRVSQIHSAAILHLRSRVRRMLSPAHRPLPGAFMAAQAAKTAAKAC